MFDIGFWEIMLIAILALVVIGPERLPQVARTAGHWFGKTRRFIEGVKGEVESEFDTSELKRLLHNQEVQIKELQSKLSDEAGDIRSGFSYNLDDQPASQPLDDYLEFLDEDEEKDHEQIAAEKAEKARLQKEQELASRETRTFENPAVATAATDTTDKDKQKPQHDG